MRRSLVFLALLAYPLSYFLPVLRPNQWIRMGDTNSDLDHAIFEIVGLKTMRFPWSQNLGLGFPTGENFWAVPSHVTQALQWMSMWTLARVFDPVLVATLWIVIGFVTTGLVVYAISRELGVSRFLSVCSGTVVQMLPWMTIKGFHHTSFVFLAVPLGVVLLLVKMRSQHKFWPLPICGAYLILIAFFDPYWFVFSGIILVVGLTLSFTDLRQILGTTGRRTIHVSLGLFGLVIGLVGLLLSWGLRSINAGSSTRPSNVRGVFESEEIKKWTGVISDFVTPDSFHVLGNRNLYTPGESDHIFYGGISIFALTVIAAILVMRKVRHRNIRLVLVLSLIAGILSVHTISLGPVSIPSPVYLVSRLTPGIRVYARFSPIAQAIWVVLAFWMIQQIASRLGILKRAFFIAALLGLIVVDLGPYSPRSIYRAYEPYAAMRSALKSENPSGVLIPDGTLVPFELSMETLPAAVDSRLFNTYSSIWKVRLYSHAYTSSELAAYLRASRISHVLALLDESGSPIVVGEVQDATRFSTILESIDFEDTEARVDTNTGKIALLRVRKNGPLLQCAGCLLAQWLINPQPIVEGEFSYTTHVLDRRWITTPSFSIQPESIPGVSSEENVNFEVRLEVQTYPGSPTRTLTVMTDSKTEKYTLDSGRALPLRLFSKYGKEIRFSIDGCFIPTKYDASVSNSQQYCVGIARYVIKEIPDKHK